MYDDLYSTPASTVKRCGVASICHRFKFKAVIPRQYPYSVFPNALAKSRRSNLEFPNCCRFRSMNRTMLIRSTLLISDYDYISTTFYILHFPVDHAKSISLVINGFISIFSIYYILCNINIRTIISAINHFCYESNKFKNKSRKTKSYQ